MVAGDGAVYVREGRPVAVAGIVGELQASDRVGTIFTRDGRVDGTLPFDVARWAHPRSADILYSPAWTFLHLLGLPAAPTMSGRPLTEALVAGPPRWSVRGAAAADLARLTGRPLSGGRADDVDLQAALP